MRNSENLGRRDTVIVLALFIFIMLISAVTTAAQSSGPLIPYSVYGKATLNGDILPEGSKITAEIDGKVVGTYITTSEGKFGGPNLNDGKLHITEGNDGNTIYFYVESPTMHSKVKALQTAVWKSGEIEKIDLDFSGQDMVSYFYGTAKVGDSPAPVNSVITAEINGIVKGSITVKTAGSYGSADEERLAVFDGLNGNEISFYLTLPGSDKKIKADESGTWELGNTTELNLNFNGDEEDAEPVCSFYGEVFFNGSAAPAGSVITAEIDSIVRGSITVLEDGKYGSADDGKLDVYHGENGDTIHFFIRVPGHGERIEAAETSTWIANRTREFRLTFASPVEKKAIHEDEKNKETQALPKTDDKKSEQKDSSGVDSNADKQVVVEESGEYNLDELFASSENVKIGTKKGDIIQMTIAGKVYSLTVKATSDFGVLISYGEGKSIVIGASETKSLDVNGDGIADIEIGIDNIDNGKVVLNFIKHEDNLTKGGLSAMMISNNGGNIAIVAIIALIVIGGAFTYKKRGRRYDERNYKSFNF